MADICHFPSRGMLDGEAVPPETAPLLEAAAASSVWARGDSLIYLELIRPSATSCELT